MKKAAALTAIALLSSAPYAMAQCDTGNNKIALKELSQDELTLRTAIFLEMCKRLGGDLVDGDDSDVKKQVTFPTGPKPLEVEPSKELIDSMRRGKHTAVLVFI